jgi:hypothetical protein
MFVLWDSIALSANQSMPAIMLVATDPARLVSPQARGGRVNLPLCSTELQPILPEAGELIACPAQAHMR